MSKKILVVEDDGKVYKMLKDELDPSFFEIVRARAVDEAIGAAEENAPFDCFVVDLWILAVGLTLKEMEDYYEREGYAFLKNYLWSGDLEHYKWKGNEKEEKINELKSKTIICSRYVNDFRNEHPGEFSDYQLINKDYGFEKKVADLVNKICG